MICHSAVIWSRFCGKVFYLCCLLGSGNHSWPSRGLKVSWPKKQTEIQVWPPSQGKYSKSTVLIYVPIRQYAVISVSITRAHFDLTFEVYCTRMMLQCSKWKCLQAIVQTYMYISLKQEASEASSATVDDHAEPFRAALDKYVQGYVKDHYPNGIVTVSQFPFNTRYISDVFFLYCVSLSMLLFFCQCGGNCIY